MELLKNTKNHTKQASSNQRVAILARVEQNLNLDQFKDQKYNMVFTFKGVKDIDGRNVTWYLTYAPKFGAQSYLPSWVASAFLDSDIKDLEITTEVITPIKK